MSNIQAVTLRDLAKRLNDIVEENDKYNRADRNGLPVVFRISAPPRKPRQHRKKDRFFPIKHALSGMLTIVVAGVGKRNVVEISGDQTAELELI